MSNVFWPSWIGSGVDLPGVFGVFYYRSAKPKTLDDAAAVPAGAGRGADAASSPTGVTPDEICARTIRALRAAGVRHFYVSNLPVGGRGRRWRACWPWRKALGPDDKRKRRCRSC